MHAAPLALRLLLMAALVIGGVANAVAGVRMSAGASQESAPPCHSERVQAHGGHAADSAEQPPEPCCSDPENCRCGCVAFFPTMLQPTALVAPVPLGVPHPVALTNAIHRRDQGVPVRPPIV